MDGKRRSDVNTWLPHSLQKWRVTLGVAAKAVSDSSPVTLKPFLDRLTQVVKAAPLRRRHWPQWQWITLVGAKPDRRLMAPQ